MLTPIVVSFFFLFWLANALICLCAYLPFLVLGTNAGHCIHLTKSKKSCFLIFIYFCRHAVPYFCFQYNPQ